MKENRTLSWLDRPIIRGLGVSWEQGLYLLIILLALVSRLAMLGYRVQSHDESLHTKYSWNLYAGQGFQHNPLMHGPFLFHITAFSYFLFGDNDFSARLPVALMGVLVVAFPYLLRRLLGRKGALVSSFLLLISPSIMYYSRYIRHDIPAILWTLTVIFCMFRYLRTGRDRYLYILAGGLSLMYASKELAAIYVLIFAVFLLGLFVIDALRKQKWTQPGMDVFFGLALAGLAVGLIVLTLGMTVGRPELPPPPDSADPIPGPIPVWGIGGGILAFISLVAAIIFVLYGMGKQVYELRSFDLIAVIGTLSLPFAAPALMYAASSLASSVVGPEPGLASPFWTNLANLQVTSYEVPNTYYTVPILIFVLAITLLIGLLWDWRRWLIAAAVYMTIFLVLFTTVFTNGGGILTGWIGSMGYWIEQQEVERGTQPWFYYLVILPFYDFLPLLGALVALAYAGVRGLASSRLGHEQEEGVTGERLPLERRTRPLFLVFLIVWSLLSWVAYTYAGERMPWLVVHISLPMILLTGWLVGQFFGALDWQRVWKGYGWMLVLLLPALVMAFAMWISSGTQGPFQGMELDALVTTGNFLGALIGVALLGTLVVMIWSQVGARNGLVLVGVSVLLVLSMLTIRIAYRFSFVNFDHPTEFLVYAHESGDVRETMEILEELSLRVAGGPQLIDVSYGPDGSWPFYWYLRNYPNARFYPEQPTSDQVLATVIIAGQGDWDVVEPYIGDDYYQFTYTFLWWPIEDYRQLTLSSLFDWLTDPQKRAALWHIFYSRDYTLYGQVTGREFSLSDWPLHENYRLYIHKTIANQVWNFGTGPVPEEATVVPREVGPYEGEWELLPSTDRWGEEGEGPGQFSWPRGIAVAPDGSVYVADSRNHRIQQFTSDGTQINSWGVPGDCGVVVPDPGTFCEPWDVAVAPDGSVYVADTWAHRIQHFTADGAFLNEWGGYGEFAPGDPAGQGSFYGPRSVAVGPDGLVYVADTGNKRIQVFDADGAFVREFGGAGSGLGQLNEPVGLAFTPDGQLVVADSWNFRVQILETDGTPVQSWAIEGWDNPQVEEKPYLTVDDEGRVYVTDPGHYRVLVFDTAGNYLHSFGQFGFDEVSFALPMGIAVGPEGLIYVVDAAGHRVMVFNVRE
jgi:uncharacterized protein (TIGR03663 family)